MSDTAQVHRVKIPATISVEEAVIRYESSPFVEYAEPNYVWHTCATIPNDDYFRYLYGLHNTGDQQATQRWFRAPLADADIDAPEAWDIRTDASNVIVCVIDQGIQYFHPDLKDNIGERGGAERRARVDDDGNGYIDDIHGWDFYNDTNQLYSNFNENFHGTRCRHHWSQGKQRIGVAGVAWDTDNVVQVHLPGRRPDRRCDQGCELRQDDGRRHRQQLLGGVGYSRALEEAIAIRVCCS